MESLLRVSEKKELKLLSYLLVTDDYVTISTLASEFSFSVSNVWRIINKLSTTFKEHIKILIKKNTGIKVIELKSNMDTYLFIKSYYIKNEIKFIILDSLFHEDYESVQEFCDTNYISVNTFYSKKKELDKLLIINNLWIDTKNFSIHSTNDAYVREFYYLVYWDSFKTSEWPFKTIIKDNLAIPLKNFYNDNNINLNPIEQEQIYFRLAIMFTRINFQHIFDSNLVDNLIPDAILTFLHSLDNYFFTDMYIKDIYLEDEVKYLGLLLISNYSSSYIELPISRKSVIEYYEKLNPLTWQFTIAFFEKLTVNFVKDENFFTSNYKEIIQIMNFHIYSSFFSKSDALLYFPNYINDISPIIYKISEQLIYSLPLEQHPQNIPYLRYFYSLMIESYFEFKKVNIAIVLSSDRIFSNRIKHKLISLYYDSITIVENYSNTQLNKVDLLISDTNISNSSKLFILKYPYSTRNLASLKEEIEKIFLQINKLNF